MDMNSVEPADTPTSKLATEMNMATRTLHAELNKLITARLPLALPPHATNPFRYALGLQVIGGVYINFEREWHNILKEQRADTGPKHHQQILEFLASLLPRGIERTSRIEQDLGPVGTSHTAGPYERQYAKHIEHTAKQRPHALVAYAWCMYMAIFAGGRYIRAELVEAGHDFWHRAPKQDLSLEEKHESRYCGYSFLSFDGERDGEDIKDDFKSRLAGAEDLLTQAERQDVVEEAKTIFRYTMKLVYDLDERVAASAETCQKSPLAGFIDSLKMKRLQGNQLPVMETIMLRFFKAISLLFVLLACCLIFWMQNAFRNTPVPAM